MAGPVGAGKLGVTVERARQREVGIRRYWAVSSPIEDYPDDQPYPSRLVLGWRGTRPVHVVVAQNLSDNELIVVTVYEPDSELWDHDFSRRTV
jgi:hypothetical protein